MVVLSTEGVEHALRASNIQVKSHHSLVPKGSEYTSNDKSHCPPWSAASTIDRAMRDESKTNRCKAMGSDL